MTTPPTVREHVVEALESTFAGTGTEGDRRTALGANRAEFAAFNTRTKARLAAVKDELAFVEAIRQLVADD